MPDAYETPAALRELTPGARKVYAVIACHPGERLTKAAMTAEAGVSRATVKRALKEIHGHARALGVTGRFKVLGPIGQDFGYRYEVSPLLVEPCTAVSPLSNKRLPTSEPPVEQANEPPLQHVSTYGSTYVENGGDVLSPVELSSPREETTVGELLSPEELSASLEGKPIKPAPEAQASNEALASCPASSLTATPSTPDIASVIPPPSFCDVCGTPLPDDWPYPDCGVCRSDLTDEWRVAQEREERRWRSRYEAEIACVEARAPCEDRPQSCRPISRVQMVGGAYDGTTFDLQPGQRVVTGFDGHFVHVYELDNGELLFVDSYPAEEFDWTSFDREFAQYTGAVPVPESLPLPTNPRRTT